MPDGTISRYKARLCAHGGMQQWGVDYWETYAPVVNWTSVRVLLALAAIHNLESASIDFVLAYPQATLDTDVFMEIPAGMAVIDSSRKHFVLKLNKNLYGLKQTGLNWFEHLSKGLTKRGFVPSEIDPCVFLSDKALILTYVDDCLIFAKDESTIKTVLESLQEGDEGFNFT